MRRGDRVHAGLLWMDARVHGACDRARVRSLCACGASPVNARVADLPRMEFRRRHTSMGGGRWSDRGRQPCQGGCNFNKPASARIGLVHAACSKKSTLTASKGNSTSPAGVRRRTPASSSAVTSPCTALTSRPTLRAASRIDMALAPHMALRSSHRLSNDMPSARHALATSRFTALSDPQFHCAREISTR